MTGVLSQAGTDWAQFWNTLELGREGKTPWVAGFVLLLLVAVWIYRRDTSGLGLFWKIWLWSLRIAVLLILLGVALIPQERKSRIIAQVSRVVLLVDTSASMAIQDRESGSAAAATLPSRAALVQEVLEKSPLLSQLRKTHEVHLYTFDSQLTQQPVLLKAGQVPASPAVAAPATPSATASPAPPATAGNSPVEADKPIAWTELLQPRGLETRLGESLLELIRQESGETLAGLVVMTDGGSNAGVDPLSAATAAQAAKVRLIPVGVGSTRRPVNVQIAEIQAPTHVHLGDGFSLTAFVNAQGLAGQGAEVELLTRREADGGEPAIIETRELVLPEDGHPLSISFDYTPSEPGRREFRIRVKSVKPVQELVAEDNEDRMLVEVVDRKTRVLLLAGGPMRDYQFVRNLLHRDKSISLDVLLQTGSAGISQDSDNLLAEFPTTREELFGYDAILAFDPDWRRIRGPEGEGYRLLADWVYSQAGGLILVAGDVNTPQFAAASDTARQEMQPLFDLYPVIPDSHAWDQDDDYPQPWPIEFTREGSEAGFLQLTDNATSSLAAWKEFQGIYRCFPTDGVKAGATVYARLTDPRAPTEQPILLASQFFGAGRVLYLGSAETWRLRSLDEDYYDRLWIKLVREVGQGRLLRGTNRGILLLEKKQFPLGATVQVRARVLDPQFKDYIADKIPLEVYTPSGKPLTPPVELLADRGQPGSYTGAFVATGAGNYNLELAIPESRDLIKDSLSVKLPNLEYDHPEQNEPLLRSLAKDSETGGRYLTLDEAAKQLPALLPDRSTERVQFDFPRSLWDRQWMIWLLVGLLSTEWLTRKLLKLA